MFKKITAIMMIISLSLFGDISKEVTNKKIINFIKRNHIQTTDYEEVKKAVLKNIEGKSDTIIIDSRNKSNYHESHIPTAINFYESDKVKYDKNQKIIVYCRGYSCGSAAVFTKELMKRGYKNVKTYLGGMPEWSKKFFKEAGRSDIYNGFQKHTALFIDVRDYNEFARGTIPTALSIPYKNIDHFLGMLPSDKNTMIILFGNNEKDKRAFMATWKLYDLGYKNVRYYKEGIEGYKKDRMPVAVTFMM